MCGKCGQEGFREEGHSNEVLKSRWELGRGRVSGGGNKKKGV